jgi:ankyrin repeat protein
MNISSLVKKFLYLVVFACISVPQIGFAQALEDTLRAALEGDVVTLQKLLDRGTSPDTSDAEGNTLLMLAARGGHVKAAELLVSRKASINQRSKVGDTALMAACLKGEIPMAGYLLGLGAELNPPGWTPLHYAAFEGRAAMVTFLLGKGANKDAPAPNEFTALMLAIRGGHEEAAKALLYADPDVAYRTRGGETALKLALQKGYMPMVDLLKRAGAKE